VLADQAVAAAAAAAAAAAHTAALDMMRGGRGKGEPVGERKEKVFALGGWKRQLFGAGIQAILCCSCLLGPCCKSVGGNNDELVHNR
jgi:hypothetical protein